MFVVDTNVFVYAADADCPEHAACVRLLKQWRGQTPPWYATWGILYEVMRVLSHPRVFKKPLSIDKTLGFVQGVLASPGLTLLTSTDRHEAILAQTIEEVPGLRGNLVHDLHTVVLMREHGIRRIVTRDSDFHRFEFLEVVDPLTLK